MILKRIKPILLILKKLNVCLTSVKVVQGTWTPAKDFLGFPTQLGVSWKDYFLLALFAWAPNRKHIGKTLLPPHILGRLVVPPQLLQVPSVILRRMTFTSSPCFWLSLCLSHMQTSSSRFGKTMKIPIASELGLVNPKSGPPKLNRYFSELCYQPVFQNQNAVMGMSWM